MSDTRKRSDAERAIDTPLFIVALCAIALAVAVASLPMDIRHDRTVDAVIDCGMIFLTTLSLRWACATIYRVVRGL